MITDADNSFESLINNEHIHMFMKAADAARVQVITL